MHSNHHFNITPNWLDRNFHDDQPNQKLAGEITCIWTAEGWLYLAVKIDLHSRRFMSWAASKRRFTRDWAKFQTQVTNVFINNSRRFED